MGFLGLFFPVESDSEKTQETIINPPAKIIKLSQKEAVLRIIERNFNFKNVQLELKKLNSDSEKNESKFKLQINAGLESFRTNLPNNRLNIFSGTKQSNDKIFAGLEKLFKSGTYFKMEVSSVRFDTNSFEGQNTSSQFQMMAVPPMYTGAVGLTLSQELMKYSFGKTEKNKDKIFHKKKVLKRDEMMHLLTGLIARTLVDYWSLSVLDQAVKAFEKLYENTKNIVRITKQKQYIGLAEYFEVSQWEALQSQVLGQLEKTKLDRNEVKRRVLRAMDEDPDAELASLDTTEDIDYGKNPDGKWNPDIELAYALTRRIDYKNLHLEKEVAQIALENAKEEELPSIKVQGTYSSRGQNILSPSENFVNTEQGILSWKYPEIRGDLKMSYPLWDEGVKTTIRDQKIESENLSLKEQLLKREIEDELKDRRAAILSSYDVLQKSNQIEKETEKFYTGLYDRFKLGRFNSVAVKNALDMNIQSKLSVIQAKINYSINLLRYDLAKNSLLEKWNVDLVKTMTKEE